MIEFIGSWVRVRTPATSANLGPGFDSFGLALGLHDLVAGRVVDEPGVRVSVSGEGAGDLPPDETHLVASSALAAFDEMGGRPIGMEIECENAIPQARGLGSSSAAIVAGILLARTLVVGGTSKLSMDGALRLATRIEGHPDNVAPCLLGGFTIAWTGDGQAHAVRLEPLPAVHPVVFVPTTRGLTADARAALPDSVPHRDATANAARAALLVHALTTAPDLLHVATEDRLHQKYRAPGMPETAALVAHLRSQGLAAVVSGAGPSVLVLAENPDHVPDTPGWERLTPPCDAVGAEGEVDSNRASRGSASRVS
jgi:homoserine kinase